MIKKIASLVQEFEQAKSGFDTAQENLNKKTKHFINAETSGNPYLGKNINIDGTGLAYVTRKGFYKPYGSAKNFSKTSGNNGCPSSISGSDINLDNVALTKGTDYDKQASLWK